MARRKKQLPLLENILVVDAGAEGKAICKVDELIVFVSNAVPGDVIDIQVTKKRRRFMEGRAIRFHQYSKDRVDARCKHFGICGGCKWQNLDYQKQLEYKQNQVEDQLIRIGKIELPAKKTILPSKEIFYYRNKLEYTFSNRRWLDQSEIDSEEELNRNALGFHIPKMFDKILAIDQCYLQADPSNAIRLYVKDFAIKNNYSFFDIRNQEGLLRNLIIRTSSTNELMVILVFFYDDPEKRIAILENLAKQFPAITSLLYIINPKKNDTINDLEVKNFKGNDFILESMEGLKFKIGPKSFYQTNAAQAYELYKIARDFADLKGDEIVFDLYTGTGTIANFIAEKAKKVIGIEYVAEAIEDAKENSKINQINNTDFFAGDMKDVLTIEFTQTHGVPDVIITDPPRAGMHEDVTKRILELFPKKIIYVSCNPATQARDLTILNDKYRVTKIQAVDMFPHTHHVENVVLLERR